MSTPSSLVIQFFSSNKKHLRFLGGFGVLTALYVATARLGLGIDPVSGYATLVWPPTGVALVAVLVFGKKYLPAIFVGACLVNYSIGAPVLTSLGIAAGNTLEALVAVVLFERVAPFHRSLDRGKDVLQFVLVAAIISTAISATVGVISLSFTSQIPVSSRVYTWFAWWVGDALGNLIVGSFLLVWISRSDLECIRFRTLELVALFVSTVVLSVLAFGPWPVHGALQFVRPYIILPVLLWAPLRFGQRGGTLATLLVSIVAIWFTDAGLGPFVGETASERLLVLQLFMACQAFTTMILAATRAQLKGSESKYLTLIQRMKGGVAQVDSASVVVFANDSLCNMTGYRADELVGRAIVSIVLTTGRGEEITKAAISDPQSSIDNEQVRLMKKSGEEVWTEFSKAPLHDSGGTTIGSVIIFRNISERKHAERALLEAEEHFERMLYERRENHDQFEDIALSSVALLDGLSQRIRVVTRKMHRTVRNILSFASLASYELRVPLSRVLEHLERAMDTSNTVTERMDATREAREEVHTLSQHAHDLLTISKLQSGGQELRIREIDFAHYLQEFINQINALVSSRHVLLQLTTKSDVRVQIDPGRFRQVLLSLLDNALKHMPLGGRVRLGFVTEEDWVTFRFADEGEGIPNNVLHNIFDFFFQGPTELDRQNGIGLGLALVRAIVEAHHGEVSVDSEVGAGTTILIRIPTRQVRLDVLRSSLTEGDARRN